MSTLGDMRGHIILADAGKGAGASLHSCFPVVKSVLESKGD